MRKDTVTEELQYQALNLVEHEPNLKYQQTLQPWDVVVFQGNSMEPISTDIKVKSDFQTAAKRMANFAHANGSKVLYFMT